MIYLVVSVAAVDTETFISQNPLVRFSIYTYLQSQTLIRFGNSIKLQFDLILKEPGKLDLPKGDSYGDIWLWFVGAYEVVRTMADPKWKGSWSPQKHQEIVEFKKRIADIRVPFAKQELRSSRAVNAENSIFGVDHERRTYLFKIGDQIFDVRAEIEFFEELINGITSEDVLGDLRDNER